MSEVLTIDLAAWIAAGAVVGVAYFLILYRTARLLADGGPWTGAAPLYLLRGAVAVAAFWFAAQHGALPLILSLLGFLAARYSLQILLRRGE